MENNLNEGKLNVDRLMKVLSQILSEQYGCKVTLTAVPKAKAEVEKAEEIETATDKTS